MADEIDMDSLKQKIMEELADLEQLRAQVAESRAPVQLDQQSVGRLSRVDAMQQQAMNLANDMRRQTRQRALMAALKRIEANEYGYCNYCDNLIGKGRLSIDPAVTFCVNCA